MKIGIIEDDQLLGQALEIFLEKEGFEAVRARSCREALQTVDPGVSLLLVDITLPDGDGISLYREMQKRGHIPAIFLTARDEEDDMLAAFDAGADDYVVKPFSLIELSARIRANIRRATQYDGGGQETVRLGDLEIDAAGRRVWRNGMRIELTRTEFDLLFLMASSPGRAFSKENLHEAVWKEPYYGNENVLNTHMNRLRAKLKDPKKPGQEYIRTIWGIGYRVEAPADASEGRKS